MDHKQWSKTPIPAKVKFVRKLGLEGKVASKSWDKLSEKEHEAIFTEKPIKPLTYLPTISVPLFTTAMAESIKPRGGTRPMAKKLYGAAAKAHAKKMGRKAPAVTKKTKRAAVSKGGTRAIQHKAYTYTNKKGKRVTVPAHTEHIKAK